MTMIGAQTDPVTVPRYATAVNLIHKIASVLFAASMSVEMTTDEAADSYAAVWFHLRRTAERMLGRRSVALTAADREVLHDAFEVAHTAHHARPHVACVRVESSCKCEVAGLIRNCERLLEEAHAN